MTQMKVLLGRTASKLAPRLWLDLGIARHSRRFEREFWLLPQLCAGLECVVDVGGNQGVYAYAMSKHAKKVHVFEPNPICLSQLKWLPDFNIVIHPVALSTEVGVMKLRFDPVNTGIGTIESANKLDQDHGVNSLMEQDVEVKRLDDFSLSNVGFIKIDVEGHEASVVAGGIETFKASRPILLVESELRHNPEAFAKLQSMLQPLGYASWYLNEGTFKSAVSQDLHTLQSNSGKYVNNFLFVPESRQEAFDRLKQYASRV